MDSRSKLVHSVVATAANVHDATVMGELLHGAETRVWGDSAYAGQQARLQAAAPRAKDFTRRRNHRYRPLSERERQSNRVKSGIRAKVEHPFHVIKRIFGFAKVRYRGIHKNATTLLVACALANLYVVRRQLLRTT